MNLIVDTDIGTDDAVALLLALRTPQVRVDAITTVAGNTDVDSCVRNARYVLELCRLQIPVYRGAEAPFAGPRAKRAPTHGDDGLGGLGLRPRDGRASHGIAFQEIARLARRQPGQLTLVTLGPLTNVALALREAPELARSIGRAVIMAGAIDAPGTESEYAEFNVWCDPEAAAEVLSSDLPITLVDIRPSRGPCALNHEDRLHLRSLGTPWSEFAVAMCNTRNAAVCGLPDVIAMAVAIDPALVARSRRCSIHVDVSDRPSRGETTMAAPVKPRQASRLSLVETLDSPAYRRLLFAACQ